MLCSKSILIKKINELDLNNIKLNIKKSESQDIKFLINNKERKELNNIKEYICNLKKNGIYIVVYLIH